MRCVKPVNETTPMPQTEMLKLCHVKAGVCLGEKRDCLRLLRAKNRKCNILVRESVWFFLPQTWSLLHSGILFVYFFYNKVRLMSGSGMAVEGDFMRILKIIAKRNPSTKIYSSN